MHLLWILFGPSTWGAGGNMVAWVICGALSFGWLRAKLHAHHVASLAQSAKHHLERMQQAQDHHDALKKQAEKHHQEQLDRADVHAEAIKAHVTTAAKAPAAETPAPESPAAERLVTRRKPRGAAS